ncbi:hypothetical protein EJ06DRAFT_521587 [Trichodelitschia bisporula]|uniref:PA14 domain-containing protein n=1 Tax=Trichodelitschia bisporula TaxID=703511 RepID=A0A6G1HYL2_9PEZI|nr:hypothetical protein EJ06DRAFT_521587 [Trichodelitschia bisporula]
MKTITLFLLPPFLVSCAPMEQESKNLQPRQVLSALANWAYGPAKAGVTLKKLAPELDPKATREFKMWGPYKLPASNSTHAAPGLSGGIKLDPNSDTLGGMVSPPCTDCTVLKAIANLAYKDGKQADVATGVYTHHIIMSQTKFGRKQLFMPLNPPKCPGGGMFGMNMGGMMSTSKSVPSPSSAALAHSHGRRQLPNGVNGTPKISTPSKGSAPASSSSWFDNLIPAVAVFVGGGGSAGSGSAFAARNSNVKSGVYITKSDTFQFTSEIVNYDPVDKEIFLTVDFEWVPGKIPGLLDVGMGALSVDDCFQPVGQFTPPKDRAITYKGAEWTVTEDGYFVDFTPHIHDGGVNIKVFVNGKEVCESRAVYGVQGGAAVIDGKKWETISAYTPCDKAIPFRKGDKVSMTSEYDLTKYRL